MPRRTEIDPGDAELRYVQLAAILREQIETGELAPRRAVPGKKALSQRYGIAPGTAEKALRLLAREGIVMRVPGKTYFVTGPGTPAGPGAPAPAGTPPAAPPGQAPPSSPPPGGTDPG